MFDDDTTRKLSNVEVEELHSIEAKLCLSCGCLFRFMSKVTQVVKIEELRFMLIFTYHHVDGNIEYIFQ